MNELHIVIGKDGFIREQDARQSFETVVADIISGQYDEDAEKVLRIVPPKAGWPHHQAIEDVTTNVAWTIYSRCDGSARGSTIIHDSPAYRMVEQHVGIAHARTCIDRYKEVV